MTVKARLSEMHDRLTATEKRLAGVIMADPARAATCSAVTLAESADTHASSVVRLAKKLGFAGFPEFRTALHAEAFVAHLPADRLREKLASLPAEGLLGTLVRHETAALSVLAERLPDPLLQAAAAQICGAERVVACADGGARFLAGLLADRLLRIGIDATIADANPRSMALALSRCSKGDVLVVIALVRVPPLVRRLMREAARGGLRRHLIADPGLAEPCPPADVTLVTPRGAGAASQTLVVPLLVLSALVLEVTRLRADAGLAAAERYGSIRASLAERQE